METLSKKEEGRFKDFRIGSVPLPVYLVLASLICITGYLQKLPVNMLGGFAVILTLGWLLGTIGANIPVLKNFGGPAIMSLLIPSILVFLTCSIPMSYQPLIA